MGAVRGEWTLSRLQHTLSQSGPFSVSSLPPISVLLPVFNAGPYLDECLQSLERQTRSDFEVVAIDDGSEDGSGERLERWAAADPRIRVTRRPHQGLVATLNLGLERCRGELVARMDADDLADPRRLELQSDALGREPDLDLVSCLVSHFPAEEVAAGFRIYEAWLNDLVDSADILRERFVESPLPHPTIMARRRLLLEAGGYREVGWPEDYDLWLRLAEAGARFRKIPKVLYYWRHHEARLTRTDRRYAVERFLACKAFHLTAGPLSESDRVVVWGAGQTGRRLSKHLLRYDAPLTAFVDIDPRKIGRTLRSLPVRSPDELPELLLPDERCVVLAAVASRGARQLIRRHLDGLGLRETEDYWCVA